MADPLRRFSDRADDYARYRPTYPPAIVGLLEQECGLSPAAAVADIGSGTGLLAELFCENGNLVYGVEPNQPMRELGERLLQRYPKFVSVVGTAEATTLPDHSVEFVTSGQAFHWFDRERARAEFIRILKPGGWVVLIWNQRRLASTPFMVAYEQLLLTHGIDYVQVRHERTTETLDTFFAPRECRLRVFDNQQVLDLAGLQGRVLSSSFMPQQGHEKFPAMMEALRQLFDEHQVHGRVTLEYDARVFYGRFHTA